MITVMQLKGKTQHDIAEFVFKASPFSNPNSRQFAELIVNIINDETYAHIESLAEVDTKDSVPKTKYFMVWRNFDNTKLFAGSTFIPNSEIKQGVNLKQYEPPV